MYQSLQGCRALAAALVVLFHLGGTFAQDRYFGFKALDAPFAWGDAGVEFFFVLSGFLITIIHRRDFGQPKALVGYVQKRVVRIYPTYWLICLAVGLAAVAAPSLRQALPGDTLTFVKGLTLLPLDPAVVGGTGSPILFVAWSLQYEMTFYALIAVAIVSRTAVAILLGAWLLLYGYSLVSAPLPFPFPFLTDNLILLFGMGVACAYVVRSELRVPFPRLLAAAAAVAFVAYGAFETRVGRDAMPGIDRRLVFGILSSLIVVGLVRAEAAGTLVLRNRWMGLLGDASYALYLIHIPIISALVKAAMRLNLTSGAAIVGACLTIFFVCVASAVVFHLVLERPMLRWFRNRLGKATSERGAEAAPLQSLVPQRHEGLR